MSFATSLGQKKMQQIDVNSPTTEEDLEETEVEATTVTSTKGLSGSSKMGIEAEGEEDGEDAGQHHHQADPGQAPRHERQPSTICSKPIPNCPTKLLWSGYFLEFTKQNEKPPSSPIIPTK